MSDSNKAADILVGVGRVLYDTDEFAAPMARALDVNVRVVQRWRTGKMQVPAGALSDLLRLVTERREALQRVEGELRSFLPSQSGQ
jgi:hypothetical protein